MHEKHEKTVIWIGVFGGFVALATSAIYIVRSNMVANFIAKVRGK